MGIFIGGQQIVGVGEIAAEARIGVPTPAPAPGKTVVASLGKSTQKTVVASVGRTSTPRTAAELAAAQADQGTVCESAARARANNSPSAGTLQQMCAARRRANVLAGRYVADAFTSDDADLRVAMTDAGEVVVSQNPSMQEARSRIPLEANGDGQQRRGFTMAQGVRAGAVDPAFVQFASAGMARSPALFKGFTEALQASDLTQGRAGEEESGGGVPRAALIAGGAVVVLGIAAVIFKLKKR